MGGTALTKGKRWEMEAEKEATEAAFFHRNGSESGKDKINGKESGSGKKENQLKQKRKQHNLCS